jgi:hypothetical protein
MNTTLSWNVKLKSVSFPCDSDGGHIYYKVKDEQEEDTHYFHVKSITVQMENGQMSGVPWAKVERLDGEVALVNLSLCEEVVFLKE